MTDDVKRIARLIEKYLKNSLLENENIELQEWRNQSEGNERYFTDTVNEEKLQRDLANYDDYEQDKDQERRKLMRSYSKVVPSRSFPWKSLVGIAATLIIIGSVLILWRGFGHKKAVIRSIATVTNDAAPGGNKAVLTLANGSQIVLDSAGLGTLTRQGNVKVIKLDSGEIAYRHTGSATGETQYNTIATPRGGQYMVVLPDGSKVWLNAATSIRYPTVFSDSARSVELISGEAYFEVARHASQPFTVRILPAHQGDRELAVNVLGTSFDINAYADEPLLKTTLVVGSIKVIRETESVLLQPGEQAQVTMNGEAIKINKDADIGEVTAWKDGYFRFDRAGTETVMRQLARWYDVEVTYEGKLPAKEFVGTILRNVPASSVLKILEISNIHFRIEGKKIIVTP